MRIFIGALLVLLATPAFSSQRAITDTGDEVILHDNGTWKYANNPEKNNLLVIPTNNHVFNKPEQSTFLLKSTRNSSAFWVNTTKWNFREAEDNTDAEYEFQLKGEDLYGMALTESIPMPLEALANIAFGIARNAAPDAEIIKKEYRVVNGQKVIYMRINGTMEGVPFTYRGYYFTNDVGATQFITYTATSITDRYTADIEELLNGLTTQQ